jgi:dienelactone hydrolase
MKYRSAATAWLLALCSLPVPCLAQETAPKPDTGRGDTMITSYFGRQTSQLEDACLEDIDSLEQWEKQRQRQRGRLMQMLGLDPMPARTELKPVVTGRSEHEQFTVENVQFQSRPGLYVTGNLYIPRNRSGPLPAILYVCGHGQVKIDGVSYGAKAHYQHHGGWFARNGYVCLIIDTLQLGEIEGIHHGTYREGMWWWVNRGYTPAGVEAWNCIRSLDYLQSRKEVDADRLGVTGRSGGGAYSWWIAAIDERIKTAVPVAGITDLRNHVVDGCVEGHCDCMYMVNTYRWDYAMVAALVAPRPLLISNTDRDGIFPIDGVYRTYQKVRRIYELYDAGDKLALHITSGPHKDTQELRVHAFRWFNFHLQDGKTDLLETTAVKFFQPQQLKVFTELPADQRNTRIHEGFVPTAATPPVVESQAAWQDLAGSWRQQLHEKSFRGWPAMAGPVLPEKSTDEDVENVKVRVFEFESQEGIRLPLIVAHREDLEKPSLVVLNVLDQDHWNAMLASYGHSFASVRKLATGRLPDADKESWLAEQKMFQNTDWAMVYFPPRGIGPTAWNPDAFKQNQHRRRFYLLGQTLDGMRCWDVRRAIQALRSEVPAPLWLQSHGPMAGIALYASLFEKDISRLDLHDLPTSHRQGPFFLNVRQVLDMPQAVAMAAENSQVILYQQDDPAWNFVRQTSTRLDWDTRQFQFRMPAAP